mmetsp:Transcript_75174/g.125286  ORF Transcript_75174/g.125286 Transcript_75174/m.125286 type:complete len:112 (-) Transcript_75174:1981-2316(-)
MAQEVAQLMAQEVAQLMAQEVAQQVPTRHTQWNTKVMGMEVAEVNGVPLLKVVVNGVVKHGVPLVRKPLQNTAQRFLTKEEAMAMAMGKVKPGQGVARVAMVSGLRSTALR